jgi:hypothetical protein
MKVSCKYCKSFAYVNDGQCYTGRKITSSDWPCSHFSPVKRFTCDSKGIEVSYSECDKCFWDMDESECNQYRLVIRKIIEFLEPPKPRVVELTSVVRFRRVKKS